MRLLLDTHAFLWYVLDDPQMSQAAKGVTEQPAAEVFVSPASYWETAIKISIGKYSLKVPFEDFWQRAIDGNWFDNPSSFGPPRSGCCLSAVSSSRSI